MNPDRAGLLKQLDEGFFDTLRILGDEAEDAGEEWLAKGWRWLADHKLRPAAHRHGWCGWKVSAGGWAYELPGRVYNRLKGGKPKRIWRRYSSESAALLAAATAAGEWLRDGGHLIKRVAVLGSEIPPPADVVWGTTPPVKVPSPPSYFLSGRHLPVYRGGILRGWAARIDPVQREVWYVSFLSEPLSQARRASFEELQDDRQNDPLFAAHETTVQEATP